MIAIHANKLVNDTKISSVDWLHLRTVRSRLGVDTGKARTFAQTHRHREEFLPPKSSALKKFSRNLPLLRETRPVRKLRADECERKRNRIIQNNGKTTEEKSMRMRRVPFFYLACCLQTKLVKKKCERTKQERREEMDKWEKCQNWCKKYSTQPTKARKTVVISMSRQ